jgi:PadR family transcriptional regulator PadR
MNSENTLVQMRKGILEYCILLVISRGEVYASDLIEELKQARMLVVEGTLYPLLNRLYRSNILSYTWKESNAGPPRKYYVLTDEGRQFLEQLHQTWSEIRFSIDFIIHQAATTHE